MWLSLSLVCFNMVLSTTVGKGRLFLTGSQLCVARQLGRQAGRQGDGEIGTEMDMERSLPLRPV